MTTDLSSKISSSSWWILLGITSHISSTQLLLTAAFKYYINLRKYCNLL